MKRRAQRHARQIETPSKWTQTTNREATLTNGMTFRSWGSGGAWGSRALTRTFCRSERINPNDNTVTPAAITSTKISSTANTITHDPANPSQQTLVPFLFPFFPFPLLSLSFLPPLSFLGKRELDKLQRYRTMFRNGGWWCKASKENGCWW